MANFATAVVTDAGRQLINQAIAAGGQVTIINAQVGSSYPAPGENPRSFTALKAFVMDAQATSANAEVFYQSTVRIRISSASAPDQFQLNEIGVFAQIGTNPPVLFAYTSADGTGDTVTPDPGPSPVVYDYAVLIEYEGDAPVNTTITLTTEVDLHAVTHRGTGIDPIAVADSTGSGALAQTPGDATKVALGTSPQSWGPIPLHAPTHLDNGTDPIPVATVSRTGAMAKLSGKQSDCFAGDGSWQSRFLPAGVMVEFPGVNVPTGWMWADGSLQLIVTYPNLYAALGTKWGGDGITTFGLPDTRGRTGVGAGQGTGLTARTVGQAGGEETHIQTPAEMPAHTHGVNDPPHVHAISEGAGHTHPVSDPPHNHGHTENPHKHDVTDPTHAHHNTIKAQYGFAPGTVIGGTPSNVVNQVNPGVGGTDNSTVGQEWPADFSATNIGIAPASTGVANQPSATGVKVLAATTGIQVQAHATGISIQSAGGTAPGSNVMQPYYVATKIIKT